MIAAYSNQSGNYENELEKTIKKYDIGGLIFFQGDPAKQVTLTNRYQKASKYPLIIGMDAEHGVGWRLQSAMEFPKMLINGAVSNDSLVYQLGAAIARHCKALGVHVNFAPVADINSNPLNPVIGMRSFGEGKEEITRKASMYMKGSLTEGVLPVAKHFPGHGDTDTDSHKALPTINRTKEQLDSVELYPFKKMIQENLPAIMIGHLNVPSLDPSKTPASLSPVIIEQYLRETLGYNGLCFTDAMNMKGVVEGLEPGEAELKALLAGNDVLLFPENIGKAIEKIKEAIAEKRIDEKLITEKCRKVLLAKYKYVLPNILPQKTYGLWSHLKTPEDFALKQSIYKQAVTLIQNRNALLPLKSLDTLRIACLNFGAPKQNNFQSMLEKYAPIHNLYIDKSPKKEQLEEVKKQLSLYNCIIIYNNTATNNPANDFGYSKTLSELISSLRNKQLILCHPAIPYGLAKYATLPLSAILISYDNHEYAQQYAAQAIFGGTAFEGHLPVTINSHFPLHTGLKTEKIRLGYIIPEMCGISSGKFSEIDSLCETAIRIQATPGCQVLVAKDGYIIYNKAFGYNTYKKIVPNHSSNIYDVASVTKITATLPAIMKLYDEKKIQLDAPLSMYFQPLNHTNKKDITIREALCHQSGLKAYIPFFPDAIDQTSLPGPLFSKNPTQYNRTKLKDKLYVNLNYHFRDSTLSNIPKTGYDSIMPGVFIFHGYQDSLLNSILRSDLNKKKEYLYSDLGFMLLKYAAEEITHDKLDHFCENTFYKKLGAYNTSFLANTHLNSQYIVPSCVDRLYRKTEIRGDVHDPSAALFGGVAGHAGLFSTAEDLAKIMDLYLNEGTYGGEQYFSPSTVHTFTQKNTSFTNNRRALGFDKPEMETGKPSPVCSQASANSFGHSGFTGILTWCDPDNNLIYIFLSNRTYPDEFNTKLTDENIRTRIQEVIYKAIKNGK